MFKLKYLIIYLTFIILISCATNKDEAKNSRILIESNNQGTLISSNINKLKLLIPSKDLEVVKERRGGGQRNPGYFYLKDVKIDLHFSGWFEPIDKFKYKDKADFWGPEIGRQKPLNLEFLFIDNWEIAIYDIPLPEKFKEGCSAHIRAILLQDDTWLDLHLSITALKPSEVLHNILLDYFKTLQIIK